MVPFLFQAATESVNEAVIAKATVVIAVATVLYLVATVLLWLTTRQNVIITKNMFEASHRPYIAAHGVTRQDKESPKQIVFAVPYTNVGTVPAPECKVTSHVVTDGVIMPNQIKEEEQHISVLPGQNHSSIVIVFEPDELNAVLNASTLSVVFKCNYKGVTNKEYYTEDQYSYHKLSGQFVNRKSICT